MRIMVLNQTQGRTGTEYHERVEPILRSYASPGTVVDLCYPDEPAIRSQGGGSAHLGYYLSNPGLVQKTEQVAAMRPVIFERAAEAMHSMVKDGGAECIVPLGGAIIPYIVDPNDLTPEAGAPVLNPKAIGIHFAEMCVHVGLSQSPLTYPLARLSAEGAALAARR